ncbi:MAG: 4-(cytidine 5'-diphospho)-2-C-methyl-D-erythritol kinase [Saccharofermentanales bacterium]
MIRECVVRAPAKINLSLDITGVRDDGYHLLETVMQTIALSDIVRVSLTFSDVCAKELRITVDGSDPRMPSDSSNTAFRAAKAYVDKAGPLLKSMSLHLSDIEIYIEKNIPQEAGLAGGSADAAGTLWALNHLCENVISRNDLHIIAAGIGADVPFCLTGGTALCTGIGDVIRSLPDFGDHKIVLVKPGFGVSTAAAFRAIDRRDDLKRPDTDGIIRALEDGSAEKVMRSGGNVFEGFFTEIEPEIADVIITLDSNEWCKGAAMSGSGPTVFGVFDNEDRAKTVVRNLEDKYRGKGYFISLTETFDSGPGLNVSRY